jgi:type IV secretion system protein VirD4
MALDDGSPQTSRHPRMAWTPGEYIVGAAVGALMATSTTVWVATQLAALVAVGHPVRFAYGSAVEATVRLVANPAEPLAALPADVVSVGLTAALWWTSLIAVAMPIAAGARWVHRRTRARSAPSASWATGRQLADLRVSGPGRGRLVVGARGHRLIAAEPSQAVIVLGPARSGKTAGLAIPAILEWDGPVLATSVRTDLIDATYAARERRGQVWIYDPSAAITSRYPSIGWNPLDGCADWHTAQRRAAALSRAGRRGLAAADEDFWFAVAAKLIAPLLYAAATGGYSMADVVRWVDTQEELEVRAELVAAGNDAVIHAAQATWRREARTRSSAYTTAEVVLHALQDPTVLQSTVDGNIAADTLLDGTARTLFICAPSHEQERLRPMFTALLEHVIERAYVRHATSGSASRPLLIVLDEAANIATPRDLDTLASTAAGTGIQLMTVWQDMAQIQARYGQRAATVVNNHRAKLVLSGVSDEPTLRYVSQLVGDREFRSDQVSLDSTGRHGTSTGHPYFRALAPSDALRRIAPGEALLIYGHLPPASIQLRPWFADRRLRAIATRR